MHVRQNDLLSLHAGQSHSVHACCIKLLSASCMAGVTSCSPHMQVAAKFCFKSLVRIVYGHQYILLSSHTGLSISLPRLFCFAFCATTVSSCFPDVTEPFSCSFCFAGCLLLLLLLLAPSFFVTPFAQKKQLLHGIYVLSFLQCCGPSSCLMH